MATILKKATLSLSGINTAKLTSSITDATSSLKNIDLSSIVKKSTGDLSSTTSSVVSKTDVASSLKKFDDFPGSSTNLKRVTSFIAENPKLTAAGITVASGAGYVAFLMSTGLSLDEALGQLGDLVEEVVEEVVDKTVSATGNIIGGATAGVLKGLLGENYQIYLWVFAIITLLVIGFKVKNLISG